MGNQLTKAWQGLKDSFEETLRSDSFKETPKTIAIGVDPRSPVFQEQFERTPLQLVLDESKLSDDEKKLTINSTPAGIKTRNNRPLDHMRNIFKRRENEIKNFD